MKPVHTVPIVTTPQDPWQQGGHTRPGPQQGPRGPAGGGYRPGVYQGGFQPYPTSGPYSGIGPQAAPAVSPQEAAGPPKSPAVEAAFWLAVVTPLVATVLFAAEFFLFNSALNAELAPIGGQRSTNAVLVGAMAFGVVVCAVLTALWIVFGFKMRAGRDWARVTLTVFAVFWAVWAVASLFSASISSVFENPPAGLVVVSWAQPIWGLLAMVLFLALAYSKPSNWFFVAHRKR